MHFPGFFWVQTIVSKREIEPEYQELLIKLVYLTYALHLQPQKEKKN